MTGETQRPLTRIVERLDDPVFLFVLGALIVLAGAAVSGADSLRVTVPLAVLVLAGIVARVYLDLRKAPEGESVAQSVNASLFGRVKKNRITFGRSSGANQKVEARTGGNISDNTITYGDAPVRSPTGDEH